MQFSSTWPIDRNWSGATSLGESGPGSDSSEGVLRTPQSFSFIEAAALDCLILYLEYELAYNDSAVHRFNHYTTRTPSSNVCDLDNEPFKFINFQEHSRSTESLIENFKELTNHYCSIFVWL